MKYPEPTLRALLGQAIGDAFGAPFEYNKRGAEMAVRSLAEGRFLDSVADVGNRAKYARIPGLYTDDTQQALALLRACALVDDWLDAEAVGAAFIEIVAAMYDAWVPGSNAGVHRGTGKNFREVARTRAAVDTAGLGAAMRIGPAATMLPDTGEALRWAVGVSRATTSHPIALSCTALFAAHCQALAAGEAEGLTERILAWLDTPACAAVGLERTAWLEPLRAVAVFDALGEEELLAYALETGLSNKALDCAANGFALTGLPWVLHHGAAQTFPDALIGVCSSGGDSDTVAAMAACLAILRRGPATVPDWMFSQILGLEFIMDPNAWDPIRSELPLTQREETMRREVLLRELAERPRKPAFPPPNVAPLLDGEDEDEDFFEDDDELELYEEEDDEDDPLSALPMADTSAPPGTEPAAVGEGEDGEKKMPTDQLTLFS